MKVESDTPGVLGDLGVGKSNLIVSWALVTCDIRRGT